MSLFNHSGIIDSITTLLESLHLKSPDHDTLDKQYEKLLRAVAKKERIVSDELKSVIEFKKDYDNLESHLRVVLSRLVAMQDHILSLEHGDYDEARKVLSSWLKKFHTDFEFLQTLLAKANRLERHIERDEKKLEN